jgi:hypothetical protein
VTAGLDATGAAALEAAPEPPGQWKGGWSRKPLREHYTAPAEDASRRMHVSVTGGRVPRGARGARGQGAETAPGAGNAVKTGIRFPIVNVIIYRVQHFQKFFKNADQSGID